MTQPKEIWLSKGQMAERIGKDNCLVCQLSASTEKISFDDVRYLSEEHFNSLIEEKDKEIERLVNCICDSATEFVDAIDSKDKEIQILKEDNRKHLELIQALRKQIAILYVDNIKKKTP